MICTSCGTHADGNARFCPQCGNALGLDLDSPTELTPGRGDDRGTHAHERAGTERTDDVPVSNDDLTVSGLGTAGESAQATPSPPTPTPTPTSGSPAPSATPLPSGSMSPSRLGRLSSDPTNAGRFEFGEVVAERYRILGRIGGGGMGDVYRADDLRLGQAVALKFLPQSLARDPDRLARLFAEVRMARQVSHRNVCRVYDIVEHGEEAFLSMEFIDGEDLASLLRRAGRLGPEKATEIARQICAGLQAAHEKGILHRDLKPANILVDSEGVPHIADFGLAGIGEEIAGQEIRAGTPSYMAPEQVAGRGVTIQSDLYALGLLLFEMYTGKRALGGKSIRELEERRSQLFTQTSTELSTLDPAVERAISRCLELDPSMRPSSALAVAAALPGGDPLAAALAAGELPSPEMIAASGSAGTLALPIGIAALLAILLGMTAQLRLAPHAFLHEIVGLPKAVPVLSERAASLRRDFGYPDSLAADRAMGWLARRSPVDYEELLDPEHPQWDSLSTGQPSPISFWYREGPSYLIPSNLVGTVTPTDPALTTPGMVSIYLSPRGDLRGFSTVPSAQPPEDVAPEYGAPEGEELEGPKAEGASAEGAEGAARDSTVARLDVAKVFAEAELDFADFEPIPRDWMPPHFADELHTFRGRYRDRPSVPIDVRIAALGGRLVWLDIQEPWERAGERSSRGGSAGRGRAGHPPGAVIFLIFSAALLARQNVRSGLGDRRGAARLATFAAIAMSGIDHRLQPATFDLQPEWNMINVSAGIGLVLGGLQPVDLRRRWNRSRDGSDLKR
ncbi:MAG: serine/threonine-protein kinase [Candidatus Eisenbacteria bacterium]